MSKKTDNWMPLHVGDYLRDTGRLTTEAHGAYLLLIMDYWCNGAPPDNDDQLAALTRLPRARWKAMRAMLEPFFQIGGGLWRHKRVEREKGVAEENYSKRRDAGMAGAQARWQQTDGEGNGIANGNRIADVKPTHRQNDAILPLTSTNNLEDPPSEGRDPLEIQLALEAWNDLAKRRGFAVVQKFTKARKRLLAARLRDCGGLTGWHAALERVGVSRFCRGENDRGWKADFDFMLKESSFVKLMEGKYDDQPDRPARDESGGASGPIESQILRGLGLASPGNPTGGDPGGLRETGPDSPTRDQSAAAPSPGRTTGDRDQKPGRMGGGVQHPEQAAREGGGGLPRRPETPPVGSVERGVQNREIHAPDGHEASPALGDRGDGQRRMDAPDTAENRTVVPVAGPSHDPAGGTRDTGPMGGAAKASGEPAGAYDRDAELRETIDGMKRLRGKGSTVRDGETA